MSKKPTEAEVALYADLRDKFKRIERYTDEELNATISVLGHALPEAYRYLNFIDAYLERRRRKAAALP